MKKLLILMFVVSFISFQLPAYAAGMEDLEEDVEIEGIDYWTLNMNLLGGNKAFTNGNIWGNGNAKLTQAWDISFDVGKDSWPIKLVFGAVRAASKKGVIVNNNTYKTEVSEVYAGIRKYLGQRTMRIYFGGGLAGISGLIETENDTTKAKTRYSEDSLAPYAEGGLIIDMSDTYHIGVAVRQAYATKVTIDGQEGSLDYLQAGLLVGVHW